MSRVVIAEFMDEAAVDSLRSRHATQYDPGLVDRRPDLLRVVTDAEALIVRNRTQVDAALVAAAKKLRVVGRLGVGLDNIDLAACASRGVEVIPATGANALAVAEYVIACAFVLVRGAYFSTAATAAGEWPRSSLSAGRELRGRTLGLIGFGSIGRATARLGRAVGMSSIGYDPNLADSAAEWRDEQTAPRGIDPLLSEADVISLHVPLTPATRGLIDAAKLAMMKRDAILINSARGGVVNEADVAAALRMGRLGGAALDVFETEPLPPESPLTGCPNLILTPHIAGVTRESNLRVSTLIADRVAAALERSGAAE